LEEIDAAGVEDVLIPRDSPARCEDVPFVVLAWLDAGEVDETAAVPAKRGESADSEAGWEARHVR